MKASTRAYLLEKLNLSLNVSNAPLLCMALVAAVARVIQDKLLCVCARGWRRIEVKRACFDDW
jgi:hypothetical protein